MTAATDILTRFLDVLADALDDDVAGDELAARVHLSRFHLDRLVSTTAGEPPAAMRRRVLLERAAYRLTTTDRTVLDIAIEAGYASHEAFTRAFTRAYAVGPARWRRSPSGFRISSPSHVHFHPPAGIRIPAERKVTAMDLVNRMVEHHVWLVGEMLDRVEELTEEQLNAPIKISVDGIDDAPTVRSLMARLVGQMAMWNAAMSDVPYDIDAEATETIPTMRTKLGVAGPAFLDEIRLVTSEGRLDETFIDAICEPPQAFTYGGMIAHVLTFAAHRRTLVCGALADAGITDLGAGDPMHWVGQAA